MISDTPALSSAQQGRAVGGDESLALHLGQERELGGVQHSAGGRQYNLAAVVVGVDLRVDVFAAGVIGGVHMGDEAQGLGALLSRSGGQRGVDIAVLVHMGIGQAQFLQLLNEDLRQVKLAQRAGVGQRSCGPLHILKDVRRRAWACPPRKKHFAVIS